MTHVCCGVAGEVDTSLELLCSLVNEKPSEMAQYAVFVKVPLPQMICVFSSSAYSLVD